MRSQAALKGWKSVLGELEKAPPLRFPLFCLHMKAGLFRTCWRLVAPRPVVWVPPVELAPMEEEWIKCRPSSRSFQLRSGKERWLPHGHFLPLAEPPGAAKAPEATW